MRELLLALGGNARGAWGSPPATLRRAVAELARHALVPVAVSALYRTAPIGGPLQPDYLNAVVRVGSNLPPLAVLRAVKRMERSAGRKLGPRWGPRPLDIDILDDPGRRIGGRGIVWPARGTKARPPAPRRPAPAPHGQLVLPHPRLHLRAFVLVPLLDVAPFWRHPVLRRAARTLLFDVRNQARDVRPSHEDWLPGARQPSRIGPIRHLTLLMRHV